MIYIFLFLYATTLVFSWVETSGSKGSKDVLAYTFITLSLICCVAWFKPIGLGFDDTHYYSVFLMQCEYYSCEIRNPFGWETGFIYLNYISAALLSSDFGSLSVVVIFTSMMLNIFGFSKLAPIIGIPILWYLSHLFLYKEITQLRSAIAYAILFVSFYYIYIDRIKIALILVILASLFHISAIVALGVFFIRFFSVRFLFSTLIAFIFLSVLGVWGFLVSTLNFLLPPIVYSTYVLDADGFAKSVGLLNPTTIKYIFLCTFFYHVRMNVKDYHLYDFCLKLYIIAPIWLVVFSEFGTLAGRPASIFAIMEGVLLGHVVCESSRQGLSLRLAVSAFCFCLLMLNLFFIRPINLSIL